MINVLLFSALALGVAVTADVAVWRYKRESKILNFLFIFIMIFGHPFYFSVAFFALFSSGILYGADYNLAVLGAVLLAAAMTALGFLRFKIYGLKNKAVKMSNFAKFYFFTAGFIPFYAVLIDGGEMGVAALVQLLPVACVFAFIYSAIKFKIIKSSDR